MHYVEPSYVKLAAKPANSAWVSGFDDRTGSIQVGKKADIAVLDGNYNCVATFVNGQALYGN